MNGKTIRCVAAVTTAALLALTGCNSASKSESTAPTAKPTTPASSAVAEELGCKTGFGVVTSLTASERTGKATVTAAGVLLDEEGRILRCVLDVAENALGANENGTVAVPTAAGTKWEQGDAYGLKKASGIGKEWYEQAQAFSTYVQGKTAKEVEEIETEDGRATDPDLLSGCTIRIEPFLQALDKACVAARARGAGPEDTLSLGTVSTAGGTDATEAAEGQAKVSTTFVLASRDAEGRVTSAVMDVTEPYVTMDTSGTLTLPLVTPSTKLELGDSYGMKGASGIGKEWYQQSAGFCEYLKGKTAGDIRAIPATGEDTDLAAVCTIALTDMLQAAVKAVEAA